jgi:hypothetical protein
MAELVSRCNRVDPAVARFVARTYNEETLAELYDWAGDDEDF